MRIVSNYCKHCAAPYRYQASGHGDPLKIPRHLQDHEYCPGCKQAIINALAPIAKVTETKFIPTTEISIATLLKHEKAQWEEMEKTCLFPLLKQIRMSPDSPITGAVRMKINEWDHRTYSYSYPEGHPEEAFISVLIRIDIASQQIIGYQ